MPLVDTELGVLDDVSEVIFLQLSEMMKEVVVAWFAVDTCCVGS